MTELKFYEYKNYKANNPKYLVIFLHGYGSNGANLINLAREFEYILPEAHFISPNAVDPWEGGFPDSYQWFSLAGIGPDRDPAQIAKGVMRANQALDAFLQIQLKRFNLTSENLFLVGFSQGAMMSMFHGLIIPQKIAGVISYSGKLILPEHLGLITSSKPEICLVHGKLDSVLPFSNFLDAEKILKEYNIPFESHAFANLDHSIDLQGIRVGMNFIKKILK